MAELPPVDGVARFVAKGTIGGVATANIFHVLKGGTGPPWTQAEIDAACTGIRAFYAARFVPLITSDWSLGSVEGIDLTNDTGVTGAVGGSTAGGETGTTPTSAAVAQCITWKSAAHYRGGHARTYLPPPASLRLVNPNTFTTTHVTNLSAAAEGFRTDILGATWVSSDYQLVLVRRYQGKFTEGPDAGKPKPMTVPRVHEITKGVADSRPDSQRRRLGKDR